MDLQPSGGDGDNGFRIQAITFDVPEPSSVAIVALTFMGLVARRIKH